MAAATLQDTLKGGITPSFPDRASIQMLMFWLEVTDLPFSLPPNAPNAASRLQLGSCLPPAVLAALWGRKKRFLNM